MSATKDMNLTDDQAEGRACIACGKPGDLADGPEYVGSVGGVPVWACLGGCQLIARMGGV